MKKVKANTHWNYSLANIEIFFYIINVVEKEERACFGDCPKRFKEEEDHKDSQTLFIWKTEAACWLNPGWFITALATTSNFFIHLIRIIGKGVASFILAACTFHIFVCPASFRIFRAQLLTVHIILKINQNIIILFIFN